MNPLDRPSDDDLTRLERRLESWTPSPPRSGRDRILFEAGIAAGRRQVGGVAVVLLVVLLIGSSGWAWHQRGARLRLEVALAQRSRELEVALARREITAPPWLIPPVVASPVSYLALSHRLATSALDRPDSPTSSPTSSESPTHIGPVLTPISARRPEELIGL